MQSIKEVWKDIPGWEGFYQVSNLGDVRSLDRDIEYLNNGTLTTLHCKGKVLKQRADEEGYMRICLARNGRTKLYGVHRLVAQAFIPNPETKPTVNHIDGNKSNNCLSNLEWATYQEQNDHAVRLGLRNQATYSNRENLKKKLSKQVICIETNQIFESQIEAERQLGLCSTAVWYSVHTGKCAHGTHLHFRRLNTNAVN